VELTGAVRREIMLADRSTRKPGDGMMRNILLPVDGSTFSEHALPIAVDIARRAEAHLHIVQVHEAVVTQAYPAGLPADSERWDDALRTQEQEYMRSLAERCRERAGLEPVTELLEGPIAATLSRYAAEVGIDLIVMTTHGRSGISRAWIGSTADALMRTAPIPLLLIRPTEEVVDWDRRLQARHILIPLDGSELAEAAIEPAIALGSLVDARYTLLRVVLPVPFVIAPSAAAPVFDERGATRSQTDADEYLDKTAVRLRERGLHVNVEAIVHLAPALGVLDCAEDEDVGLIAMATHGRGGWSRVALGSVADKVMRGSTVPILLYRPEASGGA
jgi:nucleotide-binding universal stress UspA family protein